MNSFKTGEVTQSFTKWLCFGLLIVRKKHYDANSSFNYILALAAHCIQRLRFDPGVPGAGDEGFDEEKNCPLLFRFGDGTFSSVDADIIKFVTARLVGRWDAAMIFWISLDESPKWKFNRQYRSSFCQYLILAHWLYLNKLLVVYFRLHAWITGVVLAFCLEFHTLRKCMWGKHNDTRWPGPKITCVRFLEITVDNFITTFKCEALKRQ